MDKIFGLKFRLSVALTLNPGRYKFAWPFSRENDAQFLEKGQWLNEWTEWDWAIHDTKNEKKNWSPTASSDYFRKKRDHENGSPSRAIYFDYHLDSVVPDFFFM